MKASAELKPMGTITAQLGQRVEVGDGPKGSRLLVDVTSVGWKASAFVPVSQRTTQRTG